MILTTVLHLSLIALLPGPRSVLSPAIDLMSVVEKNIDKEFVGKVDGTKATLRIVRENMGHRISVTFDSRELKEFSRSDYHYLRDSGQAGQSIQLWRREFTVSMNAWGGDLSIRFNKDKVITSFQLKTFNTENKGQLPSYGRKFSCRVYAAKLAKT